MNELKLYQKLVEISGVDDFILELKLVHSSTYWGRYFPDRRLIRLYVLDENGEPYPESVLLKEGLHELTHHIQYHHIPFWKRQRGLCTMICFGKSIVECWLKHLIYHWRRIIVDTKYIVEIYKQGNGVESNKKISEFEVSSYPTYYPEGTEIIFGNNPLEVVKTVVKITRDMQGNNVVIHQVLVR